LERISDIIKGIGNPWEDGSVKLVSYVVMLVVLNVDMSGSDLPRGIISEEDISRFRGRYAEGTPENSYDTESLKEKFIQRVGEDPEAREAMDLFIECKYWHLVDHCDDHLSEMINSNSQLFREALILLAPWMDLGNYKDRIVAIIGSRESVTADSFKPESRKLLYDMFFYGAVENAKHGRTWCMIETCVAICHELEILAERFSWEEYEKLRKIDVREAAYDGTLTEDHFSPDTTSVWPNLPDWRSCM
jgi:hypothetical protein